MLVTLGLVLKTKAIWFFGGFYDTQRKSFGNEDTLQRVINTEINRLKHVGINVNCGSLLVAFYYTRISRLHCPQ